MPDTATWTADERDVLARLNTPWKVQQFLDSLPYNTDHQTRSPRRVLRDRRAHCSEGAYLASAALRFHGHPALVVDLRAFNDDDHVIAIYRCHGHLGAVAKSNFSGLRFREPIHRNLRELALSYFEAYFNTLGQKALRAYSRPLNLSVFDSRHWTTTEEDLEWIGERLDGLRHYALLNEHMVRDLSPVDKRAYDAGFLGADPSGTFQARAGLTEWTAQT